MHHMGGPTAKGGARTDHVILRFYNDRTLIGLNFMGDMFFHQIYLIKKVVI